MRGTHALGATLLLYEGAPDQPGPERVWALVDRHGVAVLGVSPTLIRALTAAGAPLGPYVDLSSVRIFGSTGEPWDWTRTPGSPGPSAPATGD